MSVANAYTAVPAVIPGPLTVNGLLTVNSDQGIRIGGAAPFVRVVKTTTPGPGLTYNILQDETAFDIGSIGSVALQGGLGPSTLFARNTNTLGTRINFPIDTTFAQDGTSVTNTGSTTQNTVKSKVIPANTLGAHGDLIIELGLLGNVQGATATTFFVTFAGQTVLSFSRTAVTNIGVRAIIQNENATNTQRGKHLIYDTAGSLTAQQFTGTVDTTVDQTLAVLIQSGATTDSWTLEYLKVHAVVGRTAAL